MKKIALALCASCALLLLSACGGSETNTNAGNSANANAGRTTTGATTTTNTTTTGTSPTNGPATTTTASSGGEKIGVAECDDFLEKYEACVSGKVPAEARAQFESSIKQWRSSWRQLASNPQTKPTLVQACKSSAEQARASMSAYNCNF